MHVVPRAVDHLHATCADQAVDNYEYETPSEFEDEEIDEDMAFTAEDEQQYGDMLGGSIGAGDGDEEFDEDEQDIEDEGGDMPESDEDDNEDIAAHEQVMTVAVCHVPRMSLSDSVMNRTLILRHHA